MSPGKEEMKIINENEVSIYGSDVPAVTNKKELIIIEGDHDINNWFEIKLEEKDEIYNISKLLKIPVAEIGILGNYNPDKENTYYIYLPIDKFNKLQEHYYFRFLEEIQVEELESDVIEEEKIYLDEDYYSKLAGSIIKKMDSDKKYITEDIIESINNSIANFNDIYIPISQLEEVGYHIVDNLIVFIIKSYVYKLSYHVVTKNNILIKTLRAYRENKVIEDIFTNMEKAIILINKRNKNIVLEESDIEEFENINLEEEIFMEEYNHENKNIIETMIEEKIAKTKSFRKPLNEIFELIKDLNLDENKLIDFIDKFNSKSSKTKMYDIIFDTLNDEQIEVFKMLNNSEFEELNNLDRELSIVDEKALIKKYREERKIIFNKILINLIEYRKELDEDN